MEIFILCLKQMLMMATLILIGYIIRKKDVVPPNSYIILSRCETYIFTPALSFYTMLNNCNLQTFKANYKLMLYGTAVVLIALVIAYPLSKIFVKNSNKSDALRYQRNIYKYALVFANHGFVGNFVVLGVFGEEMFFKYSLFTFVPNVVTCLWGLYVLIPKDRGAGLLKNLKKGLLTPPLIAYTLGMVVGLLGLKAYMPDFIMNACNTAGNCMGPVAMVLAGVVIGGYSIKAMLKNKMVYLVSLFRLIIIPAVFVGVLKLINVPYEITLAALIFLACPLGMNTIVYPAAYGGDTRTGAAMTMISSVFSVVTIPIMYYLFMVLIP